MSLLIELFTLSNICWCLYDLSWLGPGLQKVTPAVCHLSTLRSWMLNNFYYLVKFVTDPKAWAEHTAVPTNTVCRRLHIVSFTVFQRACFVFVLLSMKLFIHIVSFCFSSSLCKYIYFSGCEVNFWIVNACTECVLGMYLQIGMYQECGIMGGSHFFFIPSFIILFICLLSSWYVVGLQPGLFTSFFLYFCSSFYRWRRTVYAAIFQDKTNKQTLVRCQVSKACQTWSFNAKSNVHSMNNIRAPDTRLHQCFLTESVLAPGWARGAWIHRGRTTKKTVVSSSFYEGCIFHRPQSCAFFYAIEHKERNYQLITVLVDRWGPYMSSTAPTWIPI